MNKRQRKKAEKKSKKQRFVKLLLEMNSLFAPDKIDIRKSLFSTWDEEYPQYQTN